MTTDRIPAPDGLVLIDKPADWTSHDVVAKMRGIARTRKVGHAGTLDPMATGLLLLGIGRGTKLLGHLALSDKSYSATMRLGIATVTDDAEGDPTAWATCVPSADHIERAVMQLRGDIQQVPSSVSAIKVNGQRSYAAVRSGKTVELAARPVQVTRFEVLAIRTVDVSLPVDSDDGHITATDIDVIVDCSTGTYIRALARDLGRALGAGGHLTALRRTRVGGFAVESAQTLTEAAEGLQVTDMASALIGAFPTVTVSPEEAARVLLGQRIMVRGGVPGTVGVLSEAGEALALATLRESGELAYLCVFS